MGGAETIGLKKTKLGMLLEYKTNMNSRVLFEHVRKSPHFIMVYHYKCLMKHDVFGERKPFDVTTRTRRLSATDS